MLTDFNLWPANKGEFEAGDMVNNHIKKTDYDVFGWRLRGKNGLPPLAKPKGIQLRITHQALHQPGILVKFFQLAYEVEFS